MSKISVSLMLLSLRARHGLQVSGVDLSPYAGWLEHRGGSTHLPCRELAAERIPGNVLVEGTAIVEPDLAQLGMVGGRTGKLAAELSGASSAELSQSPSNTHSSPEVKQSKS